MVMPMHHVYIIAWTPMEACPPGLEREWLTAILKAMATTYRHQCQPHDEDDAATLAKLFDGLGEQWIRMRNIALTRGVRLSLQQFPVAAKGAKNGGGGAGVFALC
jgi:hypothetical protein